MRRIVRLTPDRLEELRAAEVPCARCLHWELDPVRRGRLADAAEAEVEKDAWLSTVLREWGSCGRVVLVDDAPVGLIGYAPAAYLPGAAAFATAPAGDDAVVLSTVHVTGPRRGQGLGRVLVQAMAADLLERGGVRAVEAFGSCGAAPRGTGVPAGAPADFLGAVGFRTVRPHPSTPRMRMDLRSAVTWRDEVESALARLLGVVRPERAPAPGSGRVSRRVP